MSTESIILFDNTESDSTVSDSFIFTPKNKGAGYHKKQNNLHTAIFSVSNYSGSIKLQGTLALYPGDNDWFDIDETSVNFVEAVPQSLSVNFRGNFIWIRAAYTVLSGSINQIRYNH